MYVYRTHITQYTDVIDKVFYTAIKSTYRQKNADRPIGHK